jgi:hypothetical protein
MAANVVSLTVCSPRNNTGPDAIVGRSSGGNAAGTGVGQGGAAALAWSAAQYVEAFAAGTVPISTTQAAPMGPQITVMDGCTIATQTYTFTGNGTAADTVTINGQALTAVASGAVNNQWNVGTSTATAAANLLACINSSTTAAINQTVLAYISPTNSAVVVVACLFGGVIGNLITTAKASTSITVGGATLTGGAANTPQTLGH